MKLTPFLIFLILLFVLVISVLFINNTGVNPGKEGMVAYQQSLPNNTAIVMPAYSQNNVVKLNDGFYFDPTNGNLIEVDGHPSGVPDATGASVQHLIITTRSNPSTSQEYAINGNTRQHTSYESLISPVSNSNNSYSIKNSGNNSDQTLVGYSAWKTNTCINVLVNSNSHANTGGLNIANVTNIYSYYFSHGSGTGSYVALSIDVSPASLGYSPPDTDADIGNSVPLPAYGSANVIKINHFVYYDNANAKLIVVNGTTTTVYNNSGEIVTAATTTTSTPTPTAASTPTPTTTAAPASAIVHSAVVSSTSSNPQFKSWAIIEPNSNKLIIFNSINATDAVILLGGYTNSNKTDFEFITSLRITPTGIDNGTGVGAGANAIPNTNTDAGYQQMPPQNQDVEYYLLGLLSSYYGNANGNQNESPFSGGQWPPNQRQQFNPNYSNNNNYILKTQVVPPVCPSCPSCSTCNTTGNGACSNCGGQGGSGTLSSSGNSIVDNSQNYISNAASGLKNLAENTGSGVKNFAENTGSGVKNFAENTGSGVKNFAENTGSGVKDLVEDTGSGVKDLLENTGSGVKNLVENTGSGLKSLITDNGTYGGNGAYRNDNINAGSGNAIGSRSGAGYMGTRNQYNTALDQYSYFGKLPDKDSGNYLPVTADFSRFGR
jgi:hypothetical protein